METYEVTRFFAKSNLPHFVNRIIWLLLIHCTVMYVSAAETVPVEVFAKLPTVSNPQISPDGKYLATVNIVDGQQYIVVNKILSKDDTTPEKPSVIAFGEKLSFNWHRWANNERLIVSIRGTAAYRGDLWNLNRLVSVDRKGGDVVAFKMKTNEFGFYRQTANVINWLENDDKHILAALEDVKNSWATPQVHRVNVFTGKKKLIDRNSIGVYEWIADKSGELRVGVKYETKFNRRGVTVLYRERKKSKWETLQKVDYFNHDRLIPYRFDDDPNILLVSADSLLNGEDIDEIDKELFTYDLTLREVTGVYRNTRQEEILSIIRGSLPGKKGKMISHTKDKNRYVFEVYSDVKPPDYYILDMKFGRFDKIASEYPELESIPLASMDRVSYLARDGLEIPAYLSIPPGVDKKMLPMIIYPHGGPWAQDSWGFDNYVQFFTNRGYAVFQPQFRGSTGLGIEHEEAGYGQWGYAIQDDITDGVMWLVEQGIADPERICIVGSSFGGYAAAVGLTKTPELYKCGISVNGVLDLKRFIDSSRQLLFKTVNRAMWNNRSEAEEASPYHLAENIKSPLLLIGSERDTIVPVEHSVRMLKKLEKLGKEVEYVELPNGEHWRTDEKNEILKMSTIEKFLAKHLYYRD